MKRILSLILALCMMFCTALPAFAMEADSIPPTAKDIDTTEICLFAADVNGNPLIGAVYDLLTDGGMYIQELVTDESGMAYSERIPCDSNYYLAEYTAPEGYQPTEALFTIDLSEYAPPSIRFDTWYEPIMGQIKVIKTDESGRILPGVSFEVSNQSGTVVDDITTGEDGTATTVSLPYGEYILYEYSAPKGFQPGDKYEVFIEEHDTITETHIVNYFSSGDLKITAAGTDGRVIADAAFSIYNANTHALVNTVQTGADGFVHENFLPLDDYYVVQESAPAPYKPDKAHHTFTLDFNNKSHVLNVENEVGSGIVKILKSGEDGAALSGVAFDVYSTLSNEKVGNLLTDATGTASLELPLGHYELVETATVPGYLLPTDKVPFTLTEDGAMVELPIMNQKESCTPEGGHIRLLKRDADTSDTLTGAIFGIYHAATNKYAGEIATGSDGTATSLLLPAGEYYLTELRAPSGYETDATQHPVTVAAGGIVEITVTNKKLPETPTEPEPEDKTGTVKIIKTDVADSNKKLSGASFSVYETVSGKKVGELLTGKDGTALLELPEGDYTVRETAAPEGYQLSTESISLHLKAGETRELSVKNTKTEPVKPTEPGTLRIVKQDKDGGKKLKDAVFGVYRSDDDKLVKKITTDRKGIAELELTEGDYYIRELEAPDGYKLKKAEVNFHITTGETKELTVKNAKDNSEDEIGTLRIIKEDKETGDPLKNAVFIIYDSDDEEIDELTTGKDGTAELDLPVGSYYLRESEAPKGYKLDRKKIAFKVTEDKTIKVTVENVKKKDAEKIGTLQIVKSAAGTGKRLEGAAFAVYAASGDKRLSELTTDIDGVATLELSPGDYYLKELRAPEGFKQESTRILFSITKDRKTVVEITNEAVGAPATSPEQPTTPTAPTNPTAPIVPEISLPQTGEAFPTLQYALAMLCMGFAALCGVVLYRKGGKC